MSVAVDKIIGMLPEHYRLYCCTVCMRTFPPLGRLPSCEISQLIEATRLSQLSGPAPPFPPSPPLPQSRGSSMCCWLLSCHAFTLNRLHLGYFISYSMGGTGIHISLSKWSERRHQNHLLLQFIKHMRKCTCSTLPQSRCFSTRGLGGVCEGLPYWRGGLGIHVGCVSRHTEININATWRSVARRVKTPKSTWSAIAELTLTTGNYRHQEHKGMWLNWCLVRF